MNDSQNMCKFLQLCRKLVSNIFIPIHLHDIYYIDYGSKREEINALEEKWFSLSLVTRILNIFHIS